jgi:hypothetical protein
MFSYDRVLGAAVETPPQSIVDVLQTLQTIQPPVSTAMASSGLTGCTFRGTIPEQNGTQFTDYTSLK